MTELLTKNKKWLGSVLLANAIPFFGVLFLDWTTAEVLWAYFAEVIAISFYSGLYVLLMIIEKVKERNFLGLVALLLPTMFLNLLFVFVTWNMILIGGVTGAYSIDDLPPQMLGDLLLVMIGTYGVYFFVDILGQKQWKSVPGWWIYVRPFVYNVVMYVFLALLFFGNFLVQGVLLGRETITQPSLLVLVFFMLIKFTMAYILGFIEQLKTIPSND